MCPHSNVCLHNGHDQRLSLQHEHEEFCEENITWRRRCPEKTMVIHGHLQSLGKQDEASSSDSVWLNRVNVASQAQGYHFVEKTIGHNHVVNQTVGGAHIEGTSLLYQMLNDFIYFVRSFWLADINQKQNAQMNTRSDPWPLMFHDVSSLQNEVLDLHLFR